MDSTDTNSTSGISTFFLIIIFVVFIFGIIYFKDEIQEKIISPLIINNSSSKPILPVLSALTAPSDPSVPSDPSIPSDPSVPSDPSIPSDPSVPSDPSIPSDPSDPSDSNIPVTVAPPGSLKQPEPKYTSPASQTGSLTNIAIATALDPFILYTIFKSNLVKNAISTCNKILVKQASVVLKALASKLGTEALIRIGAVAGEKAAAMAAEKIAVRAAATAGAKAGTAVATAASTSATTGPAAPLVFIAEMAFMSLTMGLDLGDAGGYLKMTTNNMYVDMKKQFDEELKKILNTETENTLTDDDIPIIIGAWTKLAASTEEAKNKIMADGLEKLFNNKDPIFTNFFAKINEDIINKKVTEQELKQVEIQQKYFELYVDKIALNEKILDDYCIVNNGKIISRNNVKNCSYIDKASCENSYNWPLKQSNNQDIPTDQYAEYKSNLLNGVCILANPSLRYICDSNKLNYDTEDGLCKVTREYCLMKGADWKDNDCNISQGQDVAELIFGTTIVRGLIQIFDPKQYEPCKADEKDDGYFCRKIACKDGDEQWANAGICYPKCKPGYEALVANLCEPKTQGVPAATVRNTCSSGHNSSIGMCMDNCESGYNEIAGVCWADTYGIGAGRIPNKTACDQGDNGRSQRDDGTSCWEDVHCDTWWDSCSWRGAYGECVGGAKTNCSGCGCIRKNSWDRYYCNSDEELKGALCYTKCKQGYHNSTLNICEANVNRGRTYVPNSFPASCPSNKQDVAALCYDKCPSGYSMKSAGICKFDGTTYGRGAGYPAVTIRAKKRIIPFSTKDN